MRFAEIENGRVRFVLPSELSDDYTVMPPNAVEIALDAQVAEGDIYEVDDDGNGTFRAATVEEQQAISSTLFNAERDRLFAMTSWVRDRHSDRAELLIDDVENWAAWLEYWQALRDMPEQEGFDPANPVWPEQPK